MYIAGGLPTGIVADTVEQSTGAGGGIRIDAGRLRVADGGGVRVWDAASGATRLDLGEAGPAVSAVTFSPDGSLVVAAGAGGARAWDAATGTELAQLHEEGGFRAVAFGPDPARVVTVCTAARVWDARGPGFPLTLPMQQGEPSLARLLLGPEVGFAAFSRDGSAVVTAGDGGGVRVWDAATGLPLIVPLRPDRRTVESVDFGPDGRRLVTATSGGEGEPGTAWVWDIGTGRLEPPFETPCAPPGRRSAYSKAMPLDSMRSFSFAAHSAGSSTVFRSRRPRFWRR